MILSKHPSHLSRVVRRLKDSDVTWLYGPLHTASVDSVPPPRVSATDDRLGLDSTARSRAQGTNKGEPLEKGVEAARQGASASNATVPPTAAAAAAASASGPAASGPGADALSSSGGEGDATPTEGRRRRQRSSSGTGKGILKHRSLSEILLDRDRTPATASPSLEATEFHEQQQQVSDESELDNAAALHASRSEPSLASTSRQRSSSSATLVNRQRQGSPDQHIRSDSSSTSVADHKKPARKHISFSHRVEQCIAVDSSDDVRRYAKYQRGFASSDSSDSESEDDDDGNNILMFKSSSSRQAPGGLQRQMSDSSASGGRRAGSNSSGTQPSAVDDEPHTIARLGPTTLKSVETYPAPSPAIVWQLSPETKHVGLPAEDEDDDDDDDDDSDDIAVEEEDEEDEDQQTSVPASRRDPISPYGQAAPTYSTPNPAAAQASMYAGTQGARPSSRGSWDDNDDYGFEDFDGFETLSPRGQAATLQGTGHSVLGDDYAQFGSAGRGGSASQIQAASSYASSQDSSAQGSSSSSLSNMAGNVQVHSANVRGPHQPPPHDAQPPARKGILSSASSSGTSSPSITRSRESSSDDVRVHSVVTSAPLGTSPQSPRSSGSSSSLLAQTLGNASRAPSGREGRWSSSPRGGSDENERGRSTSRGSSSSLDRASHDYRRTSTSISPQASSYSPPSYFGNQYPASRPAVSSGLRRSRESSVESLDAVAHSASSSSHPRKNASSSSLHKMPDVPEATEYADVDSPATIKAPLPSIPPATPPAAFDSPELEQVESVDHSPAASTPSLSDSDDERRRAMSIGAPLARVNRHGESPPQSRHEPASDPESPVDERAPPVSAAAVAATSRSQAPSVAVGAPPMPHRTSGVSFADPKLRRPSPARVSEPRTSVDEASPSRGEKTGSGIEIPSPGGSGVETSSINSDTVERSSSPQRPRAQPQASYARRSLLRAARGGSASSLPGALQLDPSPGADDDDEDDAGAVSRSSRDYGFGAADDEDQHEDGRHATGSDANAKRRDSAASTDSVVGRAFEAAGSARDFVSSFWSGSRGFWGAPQDGQQQPQQHHTTTPHKH